MPRLTDEARAALLNMKGTVRNDTPDPVDRTVGKLLMDGVELTYGELKVYVEGHVVRGAKEAVLQMPRDERRKVGARITAALQKNYPKVLHNKFTETVVDDFYADLVLWSALKEEAQ